MKKVRLVLETEVSDELRDELVERIGSEDVIVRLPGTVTLIDVEDV